MHLAQIISINYRPKITRLTFYLINLYKTVRNTSYLYSVGSSFSLTTASDLGVINQLCSGKLSLLLSMGRKWIIAYLVRVTRWIPIVAVRAVLCLHAVPRVILSVEPLVYSSQLPFPKLSLNVYYESQLKAYNSSVGGAYHRTGSTLSVMRDVTTFPVVHDAQLNAGIARCAAHWTDVLVRDAITRTNRLVQGQTDPVT